MTIAARPDIEVAPEPLRAARQHFVGLFGKPEKALAFSQPEGPGGLRSVEVACFGTPPAPVVLASGGASALACSDGARREWVLILKQAPATDAPYAFLAGVASTGAEPGQFLAAAQAPKPFVGVLVLDARALPAEGRAFQRRDGVDVQVAWAIPVHDVERAYLEANGAEALWAHWQSARPDLTDLVRKPSVPR